MKKFFFVVLMALLATAFLVWSNAEASDNDTTAFGCCHVTDNSTVYCDAQEAGTIHAYIYVDFDNATYVDLTFKIIPSGETEPATLADTNPVTSPIQYVPFTRRVTTSMPDLAVELPIDKYKLGGAANTWPKTIIAMDRGGGNARVKIRGAVQR